MPCRRKREDMLTKVDAAAIEAERFCPDEGGLILRMARLESAKRTTRLKLCQGTTRPASQASGPKRS